MVVIDEYLAVRVLGGSWPEGLPDDELVLPASRHWRLLQRAHAPGAGQLSQLLAALPGGDLDVVRHPHPEVLQVLDPRPLLDDAAAIAAHYSQADCSSQRPSQPASPTVDSSGSEANATSAERCPAWPTISASPSTS